MKVPCTELYCILMNNRNVHYIVLDTSVTDSRLNLTRWLRWCDVPYTCRQTGNFCKSHSCHEHHHTLSTVSRQEPQTVLNNLFTSCEACLRIEGGQFQQPIRHALSYPAWGNVRPWSLPRVWIQVQLNSLYNAGPSTQTIEEVALTGVTWQLLVTTVYVRNTWTKHFFSPILLPKLGLDSTEILGTDWRSMSASWPKPTRTSMCALVQCTCPGKASHWFG